VRFTGQLKTAGGSGGSRNRRRPRPAKDMAEVSANAKLTSQKKGETQGVKGESGRRRLAGGELLRGPGRARVESGVLSVLRQESGRERAVLSYKRTLQG